MFCMHCGNEIPDNAAFCPSCGQPVGGPANNVFYESEPLRDIIFKRANSFVGSAIPHEIYFDDEILTILDNGCMFRLQGVDSGPHSFYVAGATMTKREKAKMKKNHTVFIPEGVNNLTYEITPTMTKVKIELL